MYLRTKIKIELIDANELARLMLESNPGDHSTAYKAVCHHCGELVRHDLRAPHSITCKNGHKVEPPLDVKTVLRDRSPFFLHSKVEPLEHAAERQSAKMLSHYGWSARFYLYT